MDYGMDYQGGGAFGGPGMAGGFGGNAVSPPPSSNTNRQQRKSYGEQTCIPVTITMLHQARSEGDDNGLVLADGRPLHHVKVIGAVRSFELMSTACMFKIEDGTGLIEVKQWLDGSSDCSVSQELRKAVQKEHIYVSIIGQMKEYDSKKTIVADSMREMADPNELTYHFLEVVYEGEKHKKQSGFVSNGPPAPMQGVGFGGQSSFANRHRAPIQAAPREPSGFTDEILQCIREEGSSSDVGVTIDHVLKRMGNRYTEDEIRAELQTLSSNGILYSTVDEDTYMVA